MKRRLLRNKGIHNQPEKGKINVKGLLAIIVGLVLIHFVLYQYLSIKNQEVVFGKVINLIDTTTKSKASQRIVVELEDGRKVYPVLPAKSSFEKDSKVKLVRYETKLFGAEKYKFAGYQKE